MNKSRLVVVVTAVLLMGVVAADFAQARLAVSAKKPVVDGVVSPNEYTYSQDFDQQVSLSMSRTADTLYVAVVGATRGWVAFGLGSERMDGADIFIGYIGADGKVSFRPQLGKGHRHGEAPADIAGSVESSAMKEAGGKTTLEVALKAGTYIKSGQSALDVIFAIGDQKSFTPYHSYRGATSIALP